MSAVIQNEYTGNGSTTQYSFTFPYLKATDIKASLDAVDTTAFTLPNATTLQFNTAPDNGVKIKIFRETGVDDLTATFYAGSAIKSEDLNDNFTQNLYKTQEVGGRFISNLGGTMTGDLNMGEDTVIKFEGATDNAHETTLTVADPTADRTITLPNVTGTVITTGDSETVATGMIANDAITNAKIANDQIDSEHYVDGSIDTAHIADTAITTAKIQGQAITNPKLAVDSVDVNKIASNSITTVKIADAQVTTAKIAADAVTSAKIADDSIDSEHYVDGSIDAAHIASNAVTNVKLADDSVGTAELQDGSVDTARLADNAVTLAKMADSSVGTSEIVDTAVTTAKLADNSVTMAKLSSGTLPTDITVASANLVDGTVATADIADNAITIDKIADTELSTLAGMQSGTASKLADSTALTADIADLNQIDGLTKQTTISDSDASFPTSGAVVDYVAAQIAPLGGLEVIATEVAFPNTQPQAGVVISISDAGGVVFNGSGTSTTGRTVGGSTVTINNAPSSLNSETLAAGVGLMVSSTGSGQIYNYHKILGKEDDIKQLSDDINDFNSRYRVGSSNPTSALDAGDLFFNTSTSKLLVYNATNTAWEEAQSIGNFFISTLSPAFDNSTQNFTITNAPTNAEQIILSINGVIQKPNAGTSTPSEGFALDGSTVKLAAAPPTGSTYFAVVVGSTVNIGQPSNNTVTTAVLQNSSVTTAKIADSAVTDAKVNASAAIQGTKISPNFGSQNIVTTGGLTVDTNTLHVDTTNNRVGIGTTSPSVSLDIEATTPTIRLTDSDATGTPECQITGGGGDLILSADRDDEKASTLMQFQTDGSAAMTIDSSQRVGIGTTSPALPLDVHGANDTTFDHLGTLRLSGTDAYNSGNAGSGISFGGKFTSGGLITTLGQISCIKEDTGDSTYDGALTFGTRSDTANLPAPLDMERMRIDSAGRVMMGVKDTSHASTNADDLCVGNNDSNFDVGITIGSNTAGSIRFADSASGGAGILEYMHGTSNLFKMYSNGTVDATGVLGLVKLNGPSNSATTMITFESGNQARGQIKSSSSDSGSPSFASYSDYRIKENIRNYTGGWDNIKAVPVKLFDVKTDGSKDQKGWIAHELQAVLPDLVQGTKDAVVTQAMVDNEESDEKELGNPIYQTVSMGLFMPDVISALQTAIAKIETLETKVAALEAK